MISLNIIVSLTCLLDNVTVIYIDDKDFGDHIKLTFPCFKGY